MLIYAHYFYSGKCQRDCLDGFTYQHYRWAHTACGVCCLDDVDDNGSISEEDMGQHYGDLCGHNPALTKCENISIVSDICDISLIYSLETFHQEAHVRALYGKISNVELWAFVPALVFLLLSDLSQLQFSTASRQNSVGYFTK